MHTDTAAMRVATSIGDAIRDSYASEVGVDFPDTGSQPFSVVRFKPIRDGAVVIVVIVNFDLSYQIEAAGYTMVESDQSSSHAQVVREVVATVLVYARSGLVVTRRWPALGKFSSTAIGHRGSVEHQSAAGWRHAKVSESWAAWR